MIVVSSSTSGILWIVIQGVHPQGTSDNYYSTVVVDVFDCYPNIIAPCQKDTNRRPFGRLVGSGNS